MCYRDSGGRGSRGLPAAAAGVLAVLEAAGRRAIGAAAAPGGLKDEAKDNEPARGIDLARSREATRGVDAAAGGAADGGQQQA